MSYNWVIICNYVLVNIFFTFHICFNTVEIVGTCPSLYIEGTKLIMQEPLCNQIFLLIYVYKCNIWLFSHEIEIFFFHFTIIVVIMSYANTKVCILVLL